MLSTTNISNIVTLAVIGSVIFSVLHARDVSAAAAVLNPSFTSNYQPIKGLENGIRLEMHTHVDRQPISNLLQDMQQDRPLAHDRSLKKTYNLADKKQSKLRDGKLGYYLPSLI